MRVGISEINELIPLLRAILPLIIPLAVIQFGLMILALISLLKKSVTTQDKIIWIIVIICVNMFGPIIYFVAGARYLDKKQAESEEQEI